MQKNAWLLVLVTFLLTACNNKKYEIKQSDKYENTKELLSDTEKKLPAKFLLVKGNDKKNLLGQTVVKGSVTNIATVVAYKDIDLKLSFYSKTGAILEEDHHIVYETIQPGATKNFKTKYFTPKGTDSVAITVVSAKY